MDPHFFDISVGLYLNATPDEAIAAVHSYSSKPGAAERTVFIGRVMAVLGGLEIVAEHDALLRFSCGSWHAAAAKRLFLEACKHDPSAQLAPRPLETLDTRSGQSIQVEPLGGGAYRVNSEGATEDTPSRAPAIASALAKLGELSTSDDPVVVSFPCADDHDSLVALLLLRAQNLRAALREEEMKASRGVLAAPSAQE
jgi:hypothetical protein